MAETLPAPDEVDGLFDALWDKEPEERERTMVMASPLRQTPPPPRTEPTVGAPRPGYQQVQGPTAPVSFPPPRGQIQAQQACQQPPQQPYPQQRSQPTANHQQNYPSTTMIGQGRPPAYQPTSGTTQAYGSPQPHAPFGSTPFDPSRTGVSRPPQPSPQQPQPQPPSHRPQSHPQSHPQSRPRPQPASYAQSYPQPHSHQQVPGSHRSHPPGPLPAGSHPIAQALSHTPPPPQMVPQHVHPSMPPATSPSQRPPAVFARTSAVTSDPRSLPPNAPRSFAPQPLAMPDAVSTAHRAPQLDASSIVMFLVLAAGLVIGPALVAWVH